MTPLAVSYFLLLIVLVTIVFWIGVALAGIINRAATRMVRLLVIVPEGLINPFKDHRPSEIELSQELYRRLGELKIPFAVEAEVQGTGEEIHFFISVPWRFARPIARLIQTLWHTAYITEANDLDPWHLGTDGGSFALGYFTQARPYSVPIALAQRGHIEPFTNVLRILSKLAPLGEGAAIQWVVRPADPRLTADVGALIAELNAGKYHISKHLHETFVITPENLELIKKKISQPLFFVNGRIAAASPADTGARAILQEIAEKTSAPTSPQLNFLKLVEPKQPEKLFHALLNQKFEDNQTMVLSAQELATLFHFPGPTTPVPKIRRK